LLPATPGKKGKAGNKDETDHLLEPQVVPLPVAALLFVPAFPGATARGSTVFESTPVMDRAQVEYSASSTSATAAKAGEPQAQAEV